MSGPLVSVLIPCFNAAAVIAETLESVLSQTWPRVEIIVVDDGSTDASGEAIKPYLARGVRLIRQCNSGAAAARNRACSEASGAFIQFLDADDLLSPDKIELQMARLAANPGCIASAEWARFYAHPSEARFEPEPVWRDLGPLDWLAASREQGLGMLFPALWLLPRDVVEAAGPWNESLTVGDDGEYFTRVVLASRRVLFCAGARCYYRSGLHDSLSGRKSSSAWTSGFRMLELCQQHVMSREDSARVRRGFALSWQHLAHASYPYDRAMAERALRQASALHDVRIRPHGGRLFNLAAGVVGWRLARKLQVASGRA